MTTAIPRAQPRAPRAGGARLIGATARAEIAMQWRRRGLWLAYGGTAALLVLLTLQAGIFLLHLPPDSLYVAQGYTQADLNNLLILGTTGYGAMFFGLLTALLVVDRLDRDRRLGMLELQRATPQGWGPYVVGKYLGNTVAVLLPIVLAYVLCGALAVVLGWPLVLVAKFAQAWLLVSVPATLATVAVVLLLTSVLPVRVVQVGFALLWIELNIGLGWRGPEYSLFNPNGLYIFEIFFPTPPMLYTEPGFHPTMLLALLNIAVLLGTALAALALTYGSLVVRGRRAEEA